MSILKISDLTIGYKDKVVATNLNAQLAKGKLTCLVGRNGVGKSTLLRTVAGLQKPLAGTIESGPVAIVLTGRPPVQMLTVREVVGLGRSQYTNMWGTLRTEDETVVSDCISQVGIDSLAERSIGTLSDGECQKVMIAKALAQQTPVILLDEPTAFLDYPSKVETMLLMKKITGTSGSALLSTHDMEMALRLADELWVMTQDHTLVCGTPTELEDLLVKEQLKINFN